MARIQRKPLSADEIGSIQNKSRIFIAIKLGNQMQDGLADIIDQLHEQGIRGRYESLANLHITLAFIGETDRVDDIKAAISKIEFEPFDIKLNRLGYFGIKVLWTGLSNENKLDALSQQVRCALGSIGVDYSSMPFNAHITLVRNPSGNAEDVEIMPSSMSVDHISVMETTYERGRHVYVER